MFLKIVKDVQMCSALSISHNYSDQMYAMKQKKFSIFCPASLHSLHPSHVVIFNVGQKALIAMQGNNKRESKESTQE